MYDAQKRYGIWSVHRDGGLPQLLVRFDHASSVGDFWADGERFYFTLNHAEGDIWMIEFPR